MRVNIIWHRPTLPVPLEEIGQNIVIRTKGGSLLTMRGWDWNHYLNGGSIDEIKNVALVNDTVVEWAYLEDIVSVADQHRQDEMQHDVNRQHNEINNHGI